MEKNDELLAGTFCEGINFSAISSFGAKIAALD
jgi:hypothetical protein